MSSNGKLLRRGEMDSNKMASRTRESHIARPMRFVSQSGVGAAAALVLSLSACGLGVTDPQGTPIEITLDFCANDTPIWFAFQDGGAPFQILTPDASGTFSFTAKGLVTLAYVRQRGQDFRTDILFTTNVALAPLNDLVCLEAGGAKQVNGTVTGHTGSQIGHVTLSTSDAFVGAGQTAWTLSQLVDRPLDLIATRVDIDGFDQHSNKAIIRRSQNPVTGATLAALDFDTEGFATGQATFTTGGIAANDHAVVYNAFHSALGTAHTMTFVDNLADGPVVIETVPVAEMSASEFHKLSAVATSPNGAIRGLERYFRTADPQNLTFGPVLIEPSITVVGRTPHVRLRTQVLGQVDYSTMINMAFHQQTTTQAIDVSMSVTASYFAGTPSEWNLPMPNFDGLPGFQNAWGLKTGVIDWRVTGYFGRPQLVWGAPPNLTAGETIAYATRASSTTVSATTMQLARAGAPRPGHFGTLVPAGNR